MEVFDDSCGDEVRDVTAKMEGATLKGEESAGWSEADVRVVDPSISIVQVCRDDAAFVQEESRAVITGHHWKTPTILAQFSSKWPIYSRPARLTSNLGQ